MLAFLCQLKPNNGNNRGSSASRGYGYKWQKARLAYLRLHPFCVDHARRGFTELATVVDHKIPHRGDMKLFWDSSNWQSLCKLCHDSWKQRLENSGVDSGCDLDGKPTDPNHHWNI